MHRLASTLLAIVFSFFFSSVALADDPPPNPKPNPPAQLTAEQIAALQSENERLKGEIAKHAKPPADPPTPKPADDLRVIAENERKGKENTAVETKKIEQALTFNLGVDTFITQNKDLLPSEIADIVRVAHKENYDTAVSKASVLKDAVVRAFFAVQSNVDALTAGQKTQLDDYLKLTKQGREERSAAFYENVFEPTLETIRKVKKAEEVGRARSGIASGTAGDMAYKDKLVQGSRKTYLGEGGIK